MEAEVLAGAGLLIEDIYMKQVIQFLLGSSPAPADNQEVEMKLNIDATSAQAFFQRLGPGRAKHLSTRLLWTQHSVRKKKVFVGEDCRS